MIAVNTQTIIFLQAILMGAVFGAVYDLFRIFRIAVPLPAGVIVAEDVIYFAFCGFMSFFLAMTVNFGQVRFFILLGELLGFLLYYLTLGVLVMKCAQQIIAFIRWIFQVLWKLILRPVVRLLMWIGKRSQKFLENWEKTRKKLCKRTENTCKLGVYYCIIILKIGELYPQKRERFFGEKISRGFARGRQSMEKQKKTSKSRLLKIAVCLFVVYIAYSIVVQQLEIRDRKITLEAVQQQCQQQIEENKEVERLLAMSADKDYIERIARERLGYAYPDEKVYIDSSKN